MIAFLSLLVILVFLASVIALAILYNRVNRVEQEVRRLSQRFPAAPAPGEKSPREPESPPVPSRVPEPPGRSSLPRPPARVPEPRAPVTTPSAPPSISLPPPRPSRSKEEWEALIGGRLLNRIGALALIIGMGFFLKYAVDRNWINETVRVAIGGVIGGGLLLVAARTHAKGLQIFSQGLVGAGISILYLSVYASFNFYHLLPQLAAFALMTGVTAIAFANAFKYDSLAVALLAWLGGFLTPFLLSTGEANELGLFTYCALLDAGILIISLRKTSWIILEPLALCATWLVYVFWYDEYYTPDAFALTLYFIIVFWLLFHVLAAGRALRAEQSRPVLRGIATAANALFASVALYRILEPEFHEWTGGAELAMSVLYASTALLTFRKRGHDRWVTFCGLTAGILLIDATAVQYEGMTTVSLWGAEALGFAWLGARWQRPYLSWLAFLLFAGAALKLVFTAGAIVPLSGESLPLFFNRRALAYATLAASAWLAGGFYAHLKGEASTTVPAVLSYGAAAMVFLLVSVEISAFFTELIRTAPETADALNFERWMALGAAWSALGAILVWTGAGRGALPLYVAGLLSLLFGICACALRGIAFDPVSGFTLVANWRFAALAFTAACSVAVVRRLEGSGISVPWQADIVATLRMIMVILILVLVTGETRDVFEREIALAGREGGARMTEEIDRWENLKQLSLSGAWMVFSIVLMAVGIWRRSRSLRIGSMVLFGITILKIFIYDLSFLDTLYRIFSFIGLGVILLAVSYAYQRYKGIILAPGDNAPPPPPAAS